MIVEPFLDHSSLVEPHIVPFDKKPGPLVIGNEDVIQDVTEYDDMSCVSWAKWHGGEGYHSV